MKKRISCFLSLVFVVGCGPNTTSENPLSPSEKEEYLHRGSQLAGTTFVHLSSALSNAMQSGGVQNAVQYCNLYAQTLVDSLSQLHNAKIRRTSLKVRNPANAPTPAELAVLQAYQEEIDSGIELKPKVIRFGQKVAYYAPIMMQGMCLKCHGTEQLDIDASDLNYIRKLYPEGKATGYKLGAFRGMWSIRFAP